MKIRSLLLFTPVLLLQICSGQTKDAERKPTVYLIGDSTVKNGTSEVPVKGTLAPAGQATEAVRKDQQLLGWGNFIADAFDLTKVTVVNEAMGGTSTRSYIRAGLWEKVLRKLQKGDYVIMQFGHNDGGPIDYERARASLKGNSDAPKEVTIKETGFKETVYSHGWYLRKFATDAKAKGAIPIICSQIPRNIWTSGKVGRADADYGKWAAEAAAGSKAFFVPLNTLIANKYDQLGADKVGAEFFRADDHTHTNAAGAQFNAKCLAEGIRALKDCPLAKYLK